MKKIDYHAAEKRRVALLVTFISGFVNAYTFQTLGGRFAGVQTGNLIYLVMNFFEGQTQRAVSYLLPLLAFMVGQTFAYFLKRFCKLGDYDWPKFGSRFLFCLLMVLAMAESHLAADFLLAGLSIFASIQLELFKKIRGVAYANTMMTGNVKNFSYLLTKALVSQNPILLRKSLYTFMIILAFVAGILIALLATTQLIPFSLYLPLFSLLYVNYLVSR